MAKIDKVGNKVGNRINKVSKALKETNTLTNSAINKVRQTANKIDPSLGDSWSLGSTLSKTNSMNNTAFSDLLSAFVGCSVGYAYETLYRSGILSKPIGIANKNFGYMFNTLRRNAGSSERVDDGYGTPIGTLAHINNDYEDSRLNPVYESAWFLNNSNKNKYANYLDYLSNVYGSELKNNFVNDDLRLADFNPALFKPTVGVIENFDYVTNGKAIVENGSINPNGEDFTDTKLASIASFALGRMLSNVKENGSIPDDKPTYGNAESVDEENRRHITQGIFSYYGLDGIYGLRNGVSYINNGWPISNKERIGDIIPWSTTDHFYSSDIYGNDNLNLVRGATGLDSGLLNRNFLDVRQGTDIDTLYYGYGNFYSNTYSLGLLNSSSIATKRFYSKAMLGYDLTSSEGDDLDLTVYNDGDVLGTPKKKYYVGNGTVGTNYLDVITASNVGFAKNEKNQVYRLIIKDAGNDNIFVRALYEYAEAEGQAKETPFTSGVDNDYQGNIGSAHGTYRQYNKTVLSEKPDLIYKTNNMFFNKEISTIIGRFHTDEFEGTGAENAELKNTALSHYGQSKGRNLLKKDHEGAKDNGYSNPYCRVWTYHHQYSKISDTIRPFEVDGGSLQMSDIGSVRRKDGEGQIHLEKYGVKTETGLVRYAPTTEKNVRNCMLSIENLAWKRDIDKLRPDQIGPLGGRIMWFPPYDLNFSESSRANWNQTSFIGRGENIYTYTNSERSGTLHFKLLIDHPECINKWRKGVNEDSIGDVDDVNSAEQTLLRFFAGCDILNGGVKPSEKKTDKVKEVKNPEIEVAAPGYEYLTFYIYFPNDYSGVDDSTFNSMNYLINGLGTGRIVNSNLKDGYEDYEWINSTYSYEGSHVGGYEMRENYGLSLNDGESISNPLVTVTDGNSNQISLLRYQTDSKNKVTRYNKVSKKKVTTVTKNYWGYRTDKSYENEYFHVPKLNKYTTSNKKTNFSNYLDIRSYQFNSVNYRRAQEIRKDNTLGLFVSFAEMFMALSNTNVSNSNILYDNGAKPLYNVPNVLQIKKMFTDDTLTLNEVNIHGFASMQGYGTNNSILSENRAKTIEKWFKNDTIYKNKFSNVKFTTFGTEQSSKCVDIYDNNAEDAKAWRCAKVTLKFHKGTVKPLSYDNVSQDNINVGDNITARMMNKANDIVKENNIIDMSDKLLSSYNEIIKLSTSSSIEINKKKLYDNLKRIESLNNKTEDTTIYGGEYEYFSDLQRNDSMTYSKITQKIKTFNPLFHSMTPEGFNARLTFLQQCVRQGSTHSASDNSQYKSANNLSFGAPPVCVLRIGDFFNTRIIITDIQYNYDNAAWDMNDEGIGVMPMMADISISFHFIGGSDLKAPITKLQNAVTFNYYANTSVYDSRAEFGKDNKE